HQEVEVLADRRAGHLRRTGELRGGPHPAVEQRQADGGAGRVGEHPRPAGQRLPFGTHPAIMPRRPFGTGRNDRDLASGAVSHVTIEPSILYVGTPVALLRTLNEDGSPNLAPMSTAWALSDVVVLEIAMSGQTAANLRARREVVINYPGPEQWEAVERLAPLTGRDPVPAEKRDRFRFERDKFAAAGLTPVASERVGPPRVAECPLQFEAVVVRNEGGAGGFFAVVHTRVLRVHAARRIVVPGTSHVDPARWSPLIYNFRHYFGLGAELGESFRTETPRAARRARAGAGASGRT